MSLHFSANQYEGAYRPWRLGAWEVPRGFPSRPRIRKGHTRIIANDRGHLLRGGARSQNSPWGPLTQQLVDQNFVSEASGAEKATAKHREIEEEEEEEPICEAGHREEKQNHKERNLLLKDDQNSISRHLKSQQNNKDDVVSENEKRNSKNLQITGSSVSGSPRNITSPTSGQETKSSSGTLTPASFRRISRASPVATEGAFLQNKIHQPVGSSESVVITNEDKENIIQEAAKLPPDTIEDALLPRRPAGDALDSGSSRALAIRLVEHPGATNCTKFTVLRPYTAPTAPPSETPLLPKRPKTSKTIRKIPEIEYALKWDLKEAIQEEEFIEDIPLMKRRHKDPQTPRSVSSEDSGINIPKMAWDEEPDKTELALKLEALEKSNNSYQKINQKSPKSTVEGESGYGTPVRSACKASLPVVRSKPSSATVADKAASIRSPSSASQGSINKPISQERISIDAKCLSANNDRSISRSSSRYSKTEQTKPESDRGSPKPPMRDPLEIMETVDSVFHKVPIRDTGYKYRPYQREEKQKDLATATTQTEEFREATTYQHLGKDNGNQVRMRNCVACEVRAQEEPTKKYVSPASGKTPFRFGRPERRPSNKPRYIKQSDRYQARLRFQSEAPRIWNINTLSSPFNNRPGYGQDQYPSHMRLRSTYQMAHTKSNKPQHTPLITKLYK